MSHPYTTDDFANALDAQKCQEVVLRFMALFDAGDFTAMEQHIVPTLVWQRPDASVDGIGQFREIMNKRDPKMQVRHVITNQLCSKIGADRMVVTSYFTVYRHLAAEAGKLPVPLSGPASVGRYRDELVREDGGWKICTKETRVDFKAG
jgi:hypothetical protein